MDIKSQTKLFKFSIPHLLWYQNNMCLRQITSSCKDSSNHFKTTSNFHGANNMSKHYYHNRNQVLLSKLKKGFTKDILFSNVAPDMMFITNKLSLPSVARTCRGLHHFSTSTNNSSLLNKIILHENPVHVPVKLYTHKVEVEPLVSVGVGWAGQPIVKRIHSILPEVHGDVCDILNAVKQLATSTKLSPSMAIEINERSEINMNENKSNTLGLAAAAPEEIKNRVRSHDTISYIDHNAKSNVNRNSKDMGNKDINIDKHKGKIAQNPILMKTGMTSQNKKHKKGVNALFTQVNVKHPKVKKRKKTKVVAKKDLDLSSNEIKISKKKKKVKAFGKNKKNKLQPNLVLSQHLNTQPIEKNVLLMENRQFNTSSTSQSPKVAVKVKQTSLKITTVKNNRQSKKNLKKESNFEDDCVCPDTSVPKERKSTKVCGEASGEALKKEKKWKPKMCKVKRQVKHRRRTFVCASKYAKDKKRKRNLPKCVKPEKKQIPRVEICPPIIEDESAKKKKRCEKLVEEVKVRKRTTVCKPVIIYAKEEAQIKLEKAICIEKKVKTRSRHTKICPPPIDEKDKMNKTKQK